MAPLVIEDASEPVSWVDADASHLITASVDGAVRLYCHTSEPNTTHPSSPELVHVVRREVLPVRCAALEKANDSPRVAVCSDELLIRVVNASDPRSITLLTGHTRGVRAATWSPGLPLLVSCGCDGDIRVWDMSGLEGACVKVLPNLLPALRPESELSSHVCWRPDGQLMAVPLKTQEIGLLHTPTSMSHISQPDAWKTIGTLGPSSGTISAEQQAPSGLISAMAFCPNGRYLAAATEDMQVTIWAMDSMKVVRTRKAEALVTGLSWHPSKDVLAWTDMQGQLVRWEGVLGASLPNPFEGVPLSVVTDDVVPLEDDLDDLFDDTLLDEEEPEDEAPSRTVRSRRLPTAHASSLLRQSAFQPSSTPMVSQRQYLAVSSIGTLVSIDQDTHQTVVFESYDTSTRRNFRFTDHYGYKVASMAPQGILFACPAESGSPSTLFFRPFDDDPGIQAEWSVNLPTGENAEIVALGGVPNVGSRADVLDGPTGLVDESQTSAATAIVATSRGFLRFFGQSGMQRYVWALGQPIVTMAACAQSVLVVCQGSSLSPAHVQLTYMVIELQQFTIMQQGHVPLSGGATLAWAGFNELGIPALYDTSGMLYTLDRAWRPNQGRWVPALDTVVALTPKHAEAQAEDEEGVAPRLHCWPIGLTATHLLGLLLPASQKHPQPTGPRPLVQELELHISMAQRDSASAPLEEAALRGALLAGAIRDARAATGLELVAQRLPSSSDPDVLDMEADKSLLQLIQLACKADKYGRALDATRALHTEATLNAALKIADFFHLPSLADRMEQIRAPMAVRQQFAQDMVDRACGTDALLRNVARISVPTPMAEAPPPVQGQARAALQQEGFASQPRRSTSASTLAREGLAHQQAPDPSSPPPSSLPTSEWSQPPTVSESAPSTVPDTVTPSPATAPTRPNPFARTHSVAKERQLQKSQSFFDRVDAPSKRKNEEETSQRSEKRSASRQSTLASFAYQGTSSHSTDDTS